MMVSKIKWIAISLGVVFFFSSCSDDADIAITEDFTVAEARGGGGDGDRNGGRDGGRDGENGNGNNGNNGGQNGGNEGGSGVLGDTRQNDPSRQSSGILHSWNDVFLTLDQDATGMRPNATARAIAYINLAAYEAAAPFMDRYSSNDQRFQGLNIDERRKSRDAKLLMSLNSTYAAVMDHFLINVPSNTKSVIASTEASNTSVLSVNMSERDKEASEEWGVYVAQQVISFAVSDANAEQQITQPQPTTYEPPAGDGYWTYSADPERALFPYWKSVRTFVISSEETSSVAPIEYSSNENSEYFAQMQEVYEINNVAKEEDGEDLWIAEYWSDDVEGLMISPPGRQVSIADQLIKQHSIDLQESLVMMLKLGFALNDAAVSTWADKYEYMVMRPNVFIHDYIDPSFQTNLYRLVYWPNPSFPGYPSGHSCFASAAAGVFIDQFGDNVRFTDTTHEGRSEFRGTPRSFNTLSEMAEENAFSRIPLGVHIRMDCTEGLRLGYEISNAVNRIDLGRRGPG